MTEGIVFPDVVVLLRQAEPGGGTEGSVVKRAAGQVGAAKEWYATHFGACAGSGGDTTPSTCDTARRGAVHDPRLT